MATATYAQVSVRLTGEELAAFDAAVARQGGTRNAMIRRVLVAWAEGRMTEKTEGTVRKRALDTAE